MAIEIDPPGGLIRLATGSDVVSLNAIRMHYESSRQTRKLMLLMARRLRLLMDCVPEAVAVTECRNNGVVGYMNITENRWHGIIFEPLIHPLASDSLTLKYHLLLWYMSRYSPVKVTAFASPANVPWKDLLGKFDFTPPTHHGQVEILSFRKTSRMDSEIGDACR
jgi:hypothetical protein